MNLSTTIIGLLVMSIFIVPVLLLTRSGKRKAKQFERDFFSVVSRNKLLISEKSFWSDYAIGVDSSKNIIIYMDKSGPEMIDKIISISDVKDFYTFPGKEERKKKNFNYHKVQRMGLHFIFKNQAESDLEISFFFPGFGKMNENDINLFEKWAEIVEKMMNSGLRNNIRDSA